MCTHTIKTAKPSYKKTARDKGYVHGLGQLSRWGWGLGWGWSDLCHFDWGKVLLILLLLYMYYEVYEVL